MLEKKLLVEKTNTSNNVLEVLAKPEDTSLNSNITPNIVKLAHYCIWYAYLHPGQNTKTNNDVSSKTGERSQLIINNDKFELRRNALHDHLSTMYGLDNHHAIEPFFKKPPRYERFWKFWKKSESTEIAGYVIKTPKETIITYHGTVTLSEAWYNLRVSKSNMSFGNNDDSKKKFQGNVHRGYKRQYFASKDSLREALQKVNKKISEPSENIIFTGHSLGGAVTQLAALDYAETKENKTNIMVITEGAPRVLGSDVVNEYNKKLGHSTLHITTQEDLAPAGVPKWMGFYRGGFVATLPSSEKGIISPHLEEAHRTVINQIALGSTLNQNNINQSRTLKEGKAESIWEIYKTIETMKDITLQLLISSAKFITNLPQKSLRSATEFFCPKQEENKTNSLSTNHRFLRHL